jgi:hypothetical protein
VRKGQRPPGSAPIPHRKSSQEERETFLHDRERQRRALAMWGRKVSYEQIGRELGCSAWSSWWLVHNGLEHLDAPEAVERRKQENLALDELERIMWGVIARPGYQVANSGRLVMDPEPGRDGRPVPLVDQSKRIAAVGQMLRIQERRAKLNGTDVPPRIDVSVSLEAAIAAVEVLEQEADRAEVEVLRPSARSRRLTALPPAEGRA